MRALLRSSVLVASLLAGAPLVGCDRTDAQLARGNLLASQGKLVEAEATYREAASSSKAARPHELLGHVLLEQGKRQEARTAYEAARKLDPSGAFEARIGLARLAADEGKVDEALSTLDEALSAQPDNLYALLSSANARLRRGAPADLQKALEHASRATTLDPKSAQAHYTRGSAELALSRFDEAGATFGRVRELAPDAPLAWYGFARLAAARDDRVAVSVNLQQARARAKTSWKPDAVLADPAFAAFKDDPSFAQAVKAP